MRAAVLLLIAGCGRLGFESTDASAIGTTCRAEVCNGFDDNCDGAIDEGCDCTPFDIAIPSTVGDGPGLVWTGSAYFVTARNGTTMATELVRVTQDGAQQPISLGAATVAPGLGSLVWTGDQLVAITTESNTVVLRAFDERGVPSPPVSLGAGSFAHGIWDQDRLVVVFVQGQSAIMREVSIEGVQLAPDIVLDNFAPQSVAATPAYRVVVGSDPNNVARIAVVERGQTAARVSDLGGSFNNMHAAANGDRVLVSVRTVPGQLFRTLDRAGNLADAMPLPASSDGEFWYASVVPAGAGYRAIGMNMPTTHTLYGYDLDLDGVQASPFDTWLTYFGNPWGWNSALVAANREATAFPHRDGDGLSQVRFVQRCR